MSAAQPAGHCVSVSWRGRAIDLEVAWVGVADAAAPVVVFLHEGLGSVSAWRGFPQAFCTELGLRGLVYSRYGYGGSAPKPAGRAMGTGLHAPAGPRGAAGAARRAGRAATLAVRHSDGGSIALLYAARFPVAGLVLVAPHLFVEDVSIESIARAREAYAATDLRGRLARHHADPDSAFRGWCDAWLNPAFRHWNIEAEIATVRRRSWPCRARATSTVRSSRSTRFSGACRKPACWSCPIAGTLHIATNRWR